MNKLVDKWKATGLLEGIEDELRREFVAKNLEESAKWLVKFSNQSSYETNSELLSGVVLPLVSRISRNYTFKIPITDLISEIVPVFNSLESSISEYKKYYNKIYEFDSKIINVLESTLILLIHLEKLRENDVEVQNTKG